MVPLVTFFLMTLVSARGEIGVCPGEGRWDDHKCNHDSRYRVCAQLIDEHLPGGAPRMWAGSDFYDIAGEDFWDITGITSPLWEDSIVANHGDSWCIDMWATAFLIRDLGCENVHVRCDATDVSYLMTAYSLGSSSVPEDVWEGARQCFKGKCVEAGDMGGMETKWGADAPARAGRAENEAWLISLFRNMDPSTVEGAVDPKKRRPGRQPGQWFNQANAMSSRQESVSKSVLPTRRVGWSGAAAQALPKNGMLGRTPIRHRFLATVFFPKVFFSTPLALVLGLFAGSGVAYMYVRRTPIETPLLST